MTTATNIRPPLPAAARPGQPPVASGAGPVGTIDPLKLATKHKWLLGGSAVAGAIVGVIAHFVWLWVYPIWTASAIFECYAQPETIGQIAPTGAEDELERFMATQVQVMLSDRLMNDVVNDPMLRTEAPKWYSWFVKNGSFNPADAAEDLKEHVSASVVTDSNFIILTFRGQDKTETAAIVRLLTEAYQRNRRQTQTLDAGERKRAVATAIASLNKQIETLKARRDRTLKDENIEILDERMNMATQDLALTQEQLVAIRAQLSALQVQLAQMVEEVNSPAGITYSDRIRAEVEHTYNIARAKERLSYLEAELLGMRQRGVGEEHRSYRNLKTRIDGARQELDAQRERLMRQRFDAEMDQLRTTIAQLQAQEADHLSKMEEQRLRANDIARVLATVNDTMNEISHLIGVKTEYEDTLKNLEALGDLPSALRVIVYQAAQIPNEVTFPKIYIMIPLGIILVVGLVTGVIVLVEMVDQRVKSPADVAMIPRTKVLGMVPHAAEDPAAPQKVETVFRDQPGGVLAESYRQLRSMLLKRMQPEGRKSLVVMAGMPGSGCTAAVVNLAHAFAAAEQRVLVIDANFRRPGVHKALGLPDAPGLADVLAGSATLQAAIRKTDDARVDLLAAGAVDLRRVERLATDAFSQILREAGAAYDIILIDTPPAMVAGDAIALANRADASMLVVRALGEKRGLVARLRNELSEAKGEFLGVLVNAVRAAAGGYLKGNIQAAHSYQNGIKYSDKPAPATTAN